MTDERAREIAEKLMSAPPCTHGNGIWYGCAECISSAILEATAEKDAEIKKIRMQLEAYYPPTKSSRAPLGVMVHWACLEIEEKRKLDAKLKKAVEALEEISKWCGTGNYLPTPEKEILAIIKKALEECGE